MVAPASPVAAPRRPRDAKKFLMLATAVVVALAGVMVPQFFLAQRGLKRSALQTDLRFLNDASNRYREQHAGKVAGSDEYDSFEEERLVRQLTLPTDKRGQVQPGGPFGPYLKAGIPPNPWNGSRDVKIASTETLPAVDGSSGWIYHTLSGQFVSNARDGGD